MENNKQFAHLKPIEDYTDQLQGVLDYAGSSISEEKKAELTANYYNAQQRKINQKSIKYLVETDWYVTRKYETGTDIPTAVVTKREKARASVVTES
jgi:maltodextrin utilization protein YvdJ